jgi:type II restriction enzyme
MAALTADQSGWAALVLGVVRRLNKRSFFLADIYAKEAEFSAIYPDNRHVREKIRQQLQFLRDLGVIAFMGSGRYELLD